MSKGLQMTNILYIFVLFQNVGSILGGVQRDKGLSGCGGPGILDTGSGIIYSHRDFGIRPHPHNEDCTWLIIAPQGKQVVLEFNFFELEEYVYCSHDYLDVHEGDSLQSPLIGRFCGKGFRKSVVSTGSKMFLHFVTDDAIENGGFKLIYSASKNFVESGCGSTRYRTGEHGVIESPHYSVSYPINMDCQWEITVEKGYRIMVSFEKPFNIELSSHCRWDYVEVTEDDSILGRFCGPWVPNPVTSKGNTIQVRFGSDEYVIQEFKGFRLVWDRI